MKFAPAWSLAAVVLAPLVMGGAVAALAEPVDVGGLTSPPQDPDVQMPEIQDAITRFKNNDLDGALAFLKAAAAKNTDLPPAEIVMADFFGQANNPQQMRAMLQQAALEHPDDPQAFVFLGELNFGERRVVEARLLYNEATRLLANFTKSAKRKAMLEIRVHGGLASTAEAAGALDEAQKHLEAVLAASPDDVIAMQRLGIIFFKQKKPEEALKQFAAARKAAPEQVLPPEVILARLYHSENDETNARKWMIEGLKNEPKDVRTRVVAAQWSLEIGQYDEALTQAEAAIQLDPASADAQFVRGLVALFKKDYAGAEKYFKQTLDLSPGNFAATNNLALALTEQEGDDKHRRAVDYAEMNYRQFPRQPEAASTLGWVYYRVGRLQEAEQAFQAASQLGPMAPDTAYYIARLYADTNRREDARKLLESVLQIKQPFSKREAAQKLADELKQ